MGALLGRLGLQGGDAPSKGTNQVFGDRKSHCPLSLPIRSRELLPGLPRPLSRNRRTYLGIVPQKSGGGGNTVVSSCILEGSPYVSLR